MNVRTYLRTANGECAIWFFRWGQIVWLRLSVRDSLGLPYRWADVKVDRGGNTVGSSLRHYGLGHAHIEIRIG